MAHHASAKKRFRRDTKRRVVNLNRLNRIRTFMRKVQDAIKGGIQEQAREAFRLAQPEMMRGVAKGVLRKNTVSRYLSRLSARIKAMAKAS